MVPTKIGRERQSAQRYYIWTIFLKIERKVSADACVLGGTGVGTGHRYFHCWWGNLISMGVVKQGQGSKPSEDEHSVSTLRRRLEAQQPGAPLCLPVQPGWA